MEVVPSDAPVGYDTTFHSSVPMSRDQVEVIVDVAYQRLPAPSIDEQCITKTWEKLCQSMPNPIEPPKPVLFNGLKFRLHDVAMLESGSAPTGARTNEDAQPPFVGATPGTPRDVRRQRCQLRLGITDYKTSIGTTTHASLYAAHASRRGEAEGASRPDALVRGTERYLANALGVEAMAITRDHFALLFRRSDLVSEYPGYYCCPGGHPEPSHILNLKSFTEAHHTDPAALPLEACRWFRHVGSVALVEEMFRSAEMEVAEEIGVPQTLCTNRGLVAIVRQAQNRKPDLCFLVDVDCAGAEALEAFNGRTAKEAFESREGSLVLMDLGQVRTPADVVAFVHTQLGGKITPASFGTLFHGVQCLSRSGSAAA